MVIFQFLKHKEGLETLYVHICHSNDYGTINIAIH